MKNYEYNATIAALLALAVIAYAAFKVADMLGFL